MHSSKNILFTYFSVFDPEKGGIERISYTLIKALKNKGYSVYAIHGEKTTEKNVLDKLATETFFLPVSNRKKLNCKENKSFYNDLIAQKNINIIINQEGNFSPSYFFLDIDKKDVKIFSVIHSEPLFNYKSLYTETFRRKSTSTPLKRWIRHIIMYPFRLKKEKYRLIKRLTFLNNYSDYIVLLSDKFKDELLKFNKKINPAKVITIQNANTYADNEIANIYTKSKEVIFVGRLSDNDKRPDRLIRIWSKIEEQHPEWILRIIGDGNEKQNLTKLASYLKLQNISFEGYKTPKSYYEKASIICLTSNFEGMPMVILEAMQHGVVPIMFESFASASDLILHKENGLLIPPFDLDKYASELSFLMNNDALRSKYAIESYKHSKKYDLDTIISKWIKYIED